MGLGRWRSGYKIMIKNSHDRDTFPKTDSHMGQDYCVGSGKCPCILVTGRGEGGQVTVAAGAKCPCPAGQTGA